MVFHSLAPSWFVGVGNMEVSVYGIRVEFLLIFLADPSIECIQVPSLLQIRVL